MTLSGQNKRKSRRQKALELFLGDTVKQITNEIYQWGHLYYQVIPYKQIKMGWSQFNKIKYAHVIYGYRELTPKMRKKLCIN